MAWTHLRLSGCAAEECLTHLDRWQVHRDGKVMPKVRARAATCSPGAWEHLPFASRANAGKGTLIATRAVGGGWFGTFDYSCPSCFRRASIRAERRLRKSLKAMHTGRMTIDI